MGRYISLLVPPRTARARAISGLLWLTLIVIFSINVLGTPTWAQRPDLSGLSPEIGTWISQVCVRERGPAFFECQNRQAAAARHTPRPDFSALSLEDRRRLAAACAGVAMEGPASYWPCLAQKAKQLATLPPAPPLPPARQVSDRWDPTVPDLTLKRASPFLTGPAPAFRQPGPAQ